MTEKKETSTFSTKDFSQIGNYLGLDSKERVRCMACNAYFKIEEGREFLLNENEQYIRVLCKRDHCSAFTSVLLPKFRSEKK